MSEAEAFRSLALVLAVGALAPLVLGLLQRVRLPEVVLMLALGMALGPHGLDLATVDDRIQFAAPANMVSLIMQGGSLCENAPNLRLDTQNVEIAAM